jgi:hypothetical protein
MATTTTARRQQRKAARFIRLFSRPEGNLPGIIAMTIGSKRTDYLVKLIATGFALGKLGIDVDANIYHVCLDGQRSLCDCKGFLRWHRCKHIDGLAALVAAGRL